MTTPSAPVDPLPRLASTIDEMTDQLRRISAELRTLGPVTTLTAQPADAPRDTPATATPPTPAPRPEQPTAQQQPTPPAPQPTPPGQQSGAYPPPSAGMFPPPGAPYPPAPGTYGNPYQPQYGPPQPGFPPPGYLQPGFPPPLPPRPSLWERLGRDGAGARVLGWAGGVVTLLGVLFLLILAVQRGYLGPLPRTLLGAALSAVLIGLALRLHRNEASRGGSYALAATGFAGLYLDVMAATALYDYLPAGAGLTAGLLVAGGGLALAHRWNTELFAVFVILGGALCAPVLTGGMTTLLLGFMLVLQLAASGVQLTRSWQVLALVGSLPPAFTALLAVLLTKTGHGVNASTALTFALITTAVAVVVSTITAVRRPDDVGAMAMVVIGTAPALVAPLLTGRPGTVLIPAVTAVVLIGVLVLHRIGSLPVGTGFAATAGVTGLLAAFQATIAATNGYTQALALLVETVLLALLADRLRSRSVLLAGAVFGLVGLIGAFATVLPVRFSTLPPVAEPTTGRLVAVLGTALLLAATVAALSGVAYRLGVIAGPARNAPVWVAAVLIVLYAVTSTLVAVGLLISPDRTGFLVGHVLVTVSWTVAALVLLLRGVNVAALRIAGFVLVAAALAKLVLFDLASLDGFARVAAFLLAGLVLLGAGTRYARLVATADDTREG